MQRSPSRLSMVFTASLALMTAIEGSGCGFPIDIAMEADTPTEPPTHCSDCGTDSPTPPTEFADPIVSEFENGEEDWLTMDTGTISYESSEGKSGAYATAVTDGNDFWVAPDKFLGKLSNAYGHSLRFSRRVEETGTSYQTDVLMISARGEILTHTFETDTSSSWTDFKVVFDDTEWTSADNETATEDEVRAVLSDLSQLLINTDAYAYSEGYCDLDQVSLEANRTPVSLPDGIQSTFEANEESWTTLKNNRVRWDAGAGTRGGYISQESGSDYWVAPAKFVGDLSSAYGLDLTFERRTDNVGEDYQFDVILAAADGTRLYYDFPFQTSPGWTRFTVRLKENGWVNEERQPAKTSEMKAVLSELSQVLISTGGYAYVDATNDLDNVAIDLP